MTTTAAPWLGVERDYHLCRSRLRSTRLRDTGRDTPVAIAAAIHGALGDDRHCSDQLPAAAGKAATGGPRPRSRIDRT